MIYRKRRKTNFSVYNSTETLQQAKMWTLYCVFFHHVIVSKFANRISKATIGKMFFWLSFLRWKGLSNWRGQPLDITSRSSNMQPFAQVYRLFVLTDIPAFLTNVLRHLEFQAVFIALRRQKIDKYWNQITALFSVSEFWIIDWEVTAINQKCHEDISWVIFYCGWLE